MSLRALVRPFLGLTLVVSFALTLEAQLNRGVIEGVVTDPQGAAVPDVAIKVTSIDTNVVLPTKTNGAGFYRVIDLVPGDYRVTFQAGGFSILDLTNVKVSAGEVIRADAQLKLGTSVQSVQVAAEVPLVETGASDFSTTVDTRTIRDTPLQGRDLQQLVFQVPGVVANGPPGSNFGFNSQFGSFPDPTHVQGSDVSVNGGKSGASAWYLDGNLNLSSMAQNVVVNPSPDATSEFQAITTAFSAEYGRTGGAVFNVVLTSGTNKVHGSLYEYGRNSFFNARNPFTSISASGEIIPQNQLHYNNFGGTLGGPVVLPHIYNGKNKTFFFFSWDTSLLHLNGNQVFTVPTPLMRQGNFSEDPNTALYGIWNPYSTVGPNSNGIFQRTAFGTPSPGNPYGANGCQNSAIEAGATTNIRPCNFSPQLPPSMLDPTAMFFVKSFPLPNYLDPLATCTLAQGGAYRICNNYLGSVGSSQDSHNISLKIDENWSDKSHFFAEWLFNPLTYNNNRLPWTGPTFPAVGFGSNLPFDMTNQIIAIGHTYTLTPTLINEFRASYSRGFYTTHPEMGGYPDSISGVSAVQQQLAPFQIPEFPPTPVPSWYINTPGGGSMAFGAVART
ncbi:MAG: carboxypeptidase regulatory-like domain-containing protein, partial [Bryobacteraceae bacterium]